MRLYEYEAKKLFEHAGLTVPRRFGVVREPGGIEGLEIEYPAMVKAMVLSGGRGKAGGVARVADAAEARAAVERILGSTIKGYRVEAVLIEQAAEVAGACYLGVTADPASFNLMLMASAAGGVDIEQVAVERPQAIVRMQLEANDAELPRAVADELAGFVVRGLEGGAGARAAIAAAARQLYAVYQARDCKVAEINPLIVTPAGQVIAADAKLVIDDNALYRQGELFALLGLGGPRHDTSELTPDEERARAAGFPYVDLLAPGAPAEPDRLYVGLVPGGAGYGIFSIDEVSNVGSRFFDGQVTAVNFMDSGGGPPLERVAEMFHLLMDKDIVDIVITSRFGGISSCDTFIRGLVQCLRERHAAGARVLAVHGRMVGTDLPSASKFLEKARAETPEPLRDLDIAVGNDKIMFDVIRDGVAKGFARKRARARRGQP